MTANTDRQGGSLSASGFRPEIQGLRAIAVLAVLVFHIWPELLPGGYVGVDVFFVISGYLITGILFRDYAATGRIHVRDFYARRIRRLLPAATVVLIAVAFLTPLLPMTRWQDNAQGIVASALYVQNWWLARQAVDYLAAESEPAMLTHFWSLSVEEQYYIFWPLLLMLAGLLPVARRVNPGRLFAWLVAAVVAASLAYSVWLTWTSPALAYFSTFTRAWELGVGGLLAVTTRWRQLGEGVREALRWIGLAMIAAAVLAYGKGTPFPGYAAALPVVGTALVIAARDSGRLASGYRLLAVRPMQYFGDISYSLYLWHWPVIIAYSALSGRSPDVLDGVVIFVVAWAMAHLGKTLVEDPFRHPARGKPDPAWKPFLVGAACILLSLGAGWGAQRPWQAGEDAPLEAATASQSGGASQYPGAAALTDGVQAMPGMPLRPSPEVARDDFPAPYASRCLSRGDDSRLRACEYGDRNGRFKVVVVGDTYAAQWQPALEEVALANGWRLVLFAKTGCAMGEAEPVKNDGSGFPACREWRQQVARRVDELKPDLLLLAQSVNARVKGAAGRTQRAAMLADSLEAFLAGRQVQGMQVAVLRGTPRMGNTCKGRDDLANCQHPRDEALAGPDPVLLLAERRNDVRVLDLTDAICMAKVCPAVVGNLVVYRDSSSHLTATYARTMAPAMARALAGLGVEGMGEVKVPAPDRLPVPGNRRERALAARRDNPDVYRDGCHVDQASSEPRFCVYGDTSSRIKIVLAGDSHAAQWLPPLQALAKTRGWALYTFTKSACAFSDTAVQSGGREYKACTEWNRRVMARLEELAPTVVVTSQSRGQNAHGANSAQQSQAMLADGLASRWGRLRRMGAGVVAIADTPWMARDVPDCLSAPRVVPGACDTGYDRATRTPDSILAAVKQVPGVVLLDLNRHICSGDTCPAMHGDAVIWRDRHHLTASFTRSLAPQIAPAVEEAIERAVQQ